LGLAIKERLVDVLVVAEVSEAVEVLARV